MQTEKESPDGNDKNAQFCLWPLTSLVCGFDCNFPVVLSKKQHFFFLYVITFECFMIDCE